MKTILTALLMTLSTHSFATSDSNTNVFIPVRHVQSEEYFIQIAPLVGCYGLPKGPQLLQLTKPYMVNNIGCGTETTENINALDCGEVVSSVESDDYSTFKEITLNISACEDKNNADFVNIIKKVVRLNFANKKNHHPKLILIK